MTYDLLRPRPGRYDLLSVFIPLMMFHFMIVCSIALGVMEENVWDFPMQFLMAQTFWFMKMDMELGSVMIAYCLF